MRHFFVPLYKKYFAILFLLWAGIHCWSSWTGDHGYGNFLGLEIVLGLNTFIGMSPISKFWRQIAPDIRSFWLGIVGFLLISLGVNSAIYFLELRLLNPEAQMRIGFLTAVWIFLIIFTFSLLVFDDVKAIRAENLRKSKVLLKIAFGIIFMTIFIIIFKFSNLLGCAVLEISMIGFFFYSNRFIRSSLVSKTRKNLFILSGCSVLLLTGFSYLGTTNEAFNPFRFITGEVEPNRFADLVRVKSVSEWISWADAVMSLTTEQKIEALVKLESMCPPRPTDNPARIYCAGEPKWSYTDFAGEIDQDKILILLKSPNVYPKLLGILSARGLDKFSPELQYALGQTAKENERLTLVSEVTLARHHKGEARPRLRISTDRSTGD